MALRGNRRRILYVTGKRAYFIIVAFVLVLAPLWVSTALGQVQTRLRIIEASNVGSSIDPALRDVHDELGSLFNFTSYKLLRDESLSLTPNRPSEINVHKEVSLEITLTNQQKKKAVYQIRILRQGSEILDTKVRLSPGKTVLIGGPKHGQGSIILAISARF
jgi:hypothetical protein